MALQVRNSVGALRAYLTMMSSENNQPWRKIGQKNVKELAWEDVHNHIDHQCEISGGDSRGALSKVKLFGRTMCLYICQEHWPNGCFPRCPGFLDPVSKTSEFPEVHADVQRW